MQVKGLRKRGKKNRLTLGKALIIVILATVIGMGYVVAEYGFPSTPAGLPYPCSGSGSVALHVHPVLRIVISGQSVTIPADIGFLGSCLEPVHTHDTSGTIHVESPNRSTQYTLGAFFQIWEVTYHTTNLGGASHPIVFNSTDILGFKADSGHKVVMLIDGVPSSEYGALVLNSLDVQTIQIEYVTNG